MIEHTAPAILETKYERNVEFSVPDDDLPSSLDGWLKATLTDARGQGFASGWSISANSIAPGYLRATFMAWKREH